MPLLSKENNPQGFLLITVLVVCTLLVTLGLLLSTHTWHDLREASQTAGEIQADLLVHSALLYYQVHGSPPLQDGQPKKIFPFPGQRGEYFTIAQEGDLLTVVGIVKGGGVAVRRAYWVPVWEPSYKEKLQ